ncbi:MAG: ABC transporter substrate-binding protein, partial [Bacillota bacterium]
MTWVLALGLLLVLGCAAKQPAAPSSAGPKYGGRLKVAMGTSIPIFDSAYASGMANLGIIDLVSETLTKINSDTGEVMPYLAESWTAEGNVWTIKLRKGVKFTDGTPFDAAAVKFNIERMLDPATKALTRSTWTMIKSVDVVDPHTVRITTHEPFGPLMAQLSYAPMGMNSPTQVQKLGNENYHTAPVGTGPFKYVEHIKGDHTLLSRNDEYWGGKPYLDEVYVKPIPEAGARVMALESGEVDVVFNVPPRDVPRLEQNPKIRVIQPPAQRTMHVGINVTRGPLKDKRVRQALNYAVDKQAIVDNIFLGKTYVSDAPVAKNVFGYHSTRVYNYDPEKAKALLKEAGYPNGFSVTLTYSPGRFLMTEEVVQAIQNDLAKVGVKVTL